MNNYEKCYLLEEQEQYLKKRNLNADKDDQKTILAYFSAIYFNELSDEDFDDYLEKMNDSQTDICFLSDNFLIDDEEVNNISLIYFDKDLNREKIAEFIQNKWEYLVKNKENINEYWEEENISKFFVFLLDNVTKSKKEDILEKFKKLNKKVDFKIINISEVYTLKKTFQKIQIL